MFSLLLTILFSALILIGLVIASALFWTYYYAAPTHQDETHYVMTSDGWKLALHHYKPKDKVGDPVLLCHGLSSNRFAFELYGAPSLAEYLKQKGRDVWVAELRGSGMSDSPKMVASDVPYEWSFDDHLTYDLPALISGVIERTGSRTVHWIGHSMGGMLILAHLEQTEDARIKSATLIGSPVDFSHMQLDSYKSLLKFENTFKRLPFFPLMIVARSMVPFINFIPDSFQIALNMENVDVTVAKRVFTLASELLPSNKLWFDFARFIKQGGFNSPEGNSYTNQPLKNSVPILIIAASKDRMASRAAVMGPCKQENENVACFLAGTENGANKDYGHLDLLVGRNCETEIFPVILKGIESIDSIKTADSL
jgi:pimeloyl-ACP methyl ester carboxylesterase